jgi:hypothetical protein
MMFAAAAAAAAASSSSVLHASADNNYGMIPISAATIADL